MREDELEQFEEALFEEIPEDSYVEILKAETHSQADNLWHIRDLISPATEKYGHDFKYDFSLDPTLMNKITEDAREKIDHLGIAVGFGHIGDSNIHLMFSCNEGTNP